jgi:DNA polymerase III subunit epsilon
MGRLGAQAGLGAKPGAQAMRQVFLDTETTGLSPEAGDRIIELGCIEYLNRRPSGRTLHVYFNPERPNSPDAVKVHGLTDEFLADKPLFASIAEELIGFVAGAEVVIHNAAFDIGFLNEEFRRLGRGAFTEGLASVTDTLAMAREMFPGKSNSLDALCRRLEVDNSNRSLHGALLDAGLLADVYIRMTRGQDSLVIESAQQAAAHSAGAAIDLAQFDLLVLQPTAEEIAAHNAVLSEVDQASGGRAIWKSAVA